MAGKRSAKPAKGNTPPAKIGRPSSYTEALAEEICERLSRGESLRSICADQEGGWVPSETSVRRWLAGDEDWNEAFRRHYACAREMQADHYAEEIIEIADAPNASVDANGEPVLRDPQRDRLRIDARKWYASKLLPKKYGDAVQLKHADAEGEKLASGDTEVAAKAAALLARLAMRKLADEGE